MQLVQLADEYHLTTAEAVDLCLAAGIAAESSDALLDAQQVVRWRNLAEQQRSWRAQADEAKAQARNARQAAQATQAAFSASFGPIPPPPWELSGTPDETATLPAPAPNAGEVPSADLDSLWHAEATSSAQISLYAAAALALSVVSLIFPFIPAMIAIPLALHARRQISASPSLTGERLAQAALAICAIGVLLWIGLLGSTVYHDQQQQRSPSTPDLQVNTATLSWDELKKGDCVRMPHADVEVANWQGVSCSSPHEAEVFAVAKTAGGAYPGRGALYAASKELCTIEFAKYVGQPYRHSALAISVVIPTPSDWYDSNNQQFGCIAHEVGFGLINGTLAGSKR